MKPVFRITCKSFVLAFFFILFGFVQRAAAQFQTNYTPLPVTDTISPKLHSELKARLARDLSTVTEKGKVGTYLKTLLEKRTDAIIKTVNADLFILDSELTGYLNGILENIYTANPSLPRETKVYPYRSEVPNAASFGKGTLCIMLGLLSRLESEDQIAFVLCHELAHHHTNHSLRRMQQLAQLNDKDLKKKIDAIAASRTPRSAASFLYGRAVSLHKLLELTQSKKITLLSGKNFAHLIHYTFFNTSVASSVS
jgi:hypothetical protein